MTMETSHKQPEPETNSASPVPAANSSTRPAAARGLVLFLAAAAALGLILSTLLWQRLSDMQAQLARQSADSGSQSSEARAMARQAMDQSRENMARLSVMEVRLSEVALQRGQLEELMQSLSRSRDENLVVDIESALYLAQQQAQLTGSVEPLLVSLRVAEQRLKRAAQPRLAPVQRAIAIDMARIRATVVSDLPTLLAKLEELVRLADELPLANAVARASPGAAVAAIKPRQDDTMASWWQRSWEVVQEELRGLVRLSRIEQPEAALLSPEQSFFLRENFKFKLLNARLGLLARQLDTARADLASAATALARYFDGSSRKTQTAAALLQQAQGQMKTLDLPRVDETLAALATAAGGR
ncbi:MAG: uroporphyrinogen-III C-methyltransferase [Hylemonella sp.]